MLHKNPATLLNNVKVRKVHLLLILSALSFLISLFAALAPNSAKRNETGQETYYPPNKTEISSDVETTETSSSGVKAVARTDVLGTETPSLTNPETTQPPASIPTPTLAQITEAPPTTRPVLSTVTLEIKSPSNSASFEISYKDGDNVCDILTRAKSEGHIQSLTIDNSYIQTLKSAYVVEINGFSNNWTFTVNGKSPPGCSLYSPKNGDVIVWKFL